MEDVKSEISKYESEIGELNKQISAIDDRRAQLVRVGVRIEGVLAYLRQKLIDAEAFAESAKAEKAAADAAKAADGGAGSLASAAGAGVQKSAPSN